MGRQTSLREIKVQGNKFIDRRHSLKQRQADPTRQPKRQTYPKTEERI